MSLLTRIERLKRIDNLIRLNATGTPKQLSEKLEISESTLYEDLNELKTLGASIKYNRYKLSYEYTATVKLVFELKT